MCDCGTLHNARMCAVQAVAAEQQRPCVIFGAELFIDGRQWCALVGKDIASGVCGFGDSPEKAMAAFDAAWTRSLEATAIAWG